MIARVEDGRRTRRKLRERRRCRIELYEGRVSGSESGFVGFLESAHQPWQRVFPRAHEAEGDVAKLRHRSVVEAQKVVRSILASRDAE